MELDKDPTLPKILVVDDREANLIAIKSILDELKIELFLVQSAKDGLRLLLKYDFVLALVDVQMPEIDGFEMAKLMREQPKTKLIPIILITAISKENGYVHKGYESGAVDFIFKPIHPNILINKVNVFLELFNQREAIKNINHKNELLLNSSTEGILGLDSKGYITFANPAAAKMLGTDIATLSRQHLHQLMYAPGSTDVPPWEETAVYKMNKNGSEYFEQSGILWRVDGTDFSVEYRSNSLLEDDTHKGSVFMFQDITRRKRAEEQLVYLANYDSLTGLASRNMFLEHLQGAIVRNRRRREIFAVFFIDLDNFKDINDTLGHSVGDALLESIGERLRHLVREDDLVARLGGDEFAVITEGIKTWASAAEVAVKIIHGFACPHLCIRHEITISPSIGIAMYPECSKTVEALLQAADTAMYHAKKKGKNNFSFFSDDMNKKALHKLEIGMALRQASKRNELEIYYQPQIDIVNNQVIAMEALLRWQSNELGEISPVEFIPIAEEIGIIESLGAWVLHKACKQIKVWEKTCSLTTPVTVAVNVSLLQLTNSNFYDLLKLLLEEYDLNPNHLEIEITESTMTTDPQAVIQLLQKIHDLDIKIAIDDFGTGFSSLNHIRTLPIDTIKIDKSFVADIGIDKKDEAIVKTIIAMAHNLDVKVIAEGVENKLQYEFLQQHQCDLMQGYLFHKPMPTDDTTKYIQDGVSPNIANI